jgi:N-acetylneuraminic acid mutarotase
MKMFKKKTSFALFLAVSFFSLTVAHKPSVAQGRERNRCRQHRFGKFSGWSEPVNLGPVINSEFNDQHPAISPDGLSLYITSDRPGSFGQFDIYVSHRASLDDDWGPPQNLGPIINTNFPDQNSVPTFSADGHRMYFCANRPGGLGGDDIWVSFREDTTDDFAWQPPTNLGSGVNTEKGECGPTIFEDRHEGVTTLYFTRCVSARPEDCTFANPNQKFDIYASTLSEDGTFGTAVPVSELNSGFRDTRTAIRSDGLEFFLTSSRPGGLGALDLWVSTRETTSDAWSAPVNLGPTINTAFNDGAPALSCDGTTMYFYSNRPAGLGKNDLYVTTRRRLRDDSWNPIAPMPTARFALATATGPDGRIYALGGDTNISAPTVVPTVEAYDPETDSWSSVAPMPTARRFLAAVALDGQIYALGGGPPFRNAVERYDPETNTWTSLGPMPTARAALAAATAKCPPPRDEGVCIYAIGGFNGHALTTVEAYDPSTDTWQAVAPLPSPQAGTPGAATGLDGKIYLMGGVDGVDTVDSVEVYDPEVDTWCTRAPLPTARRFLGGTTGPDGTIYAVGGTCCGLNFPGTGNMLDTVETYDPNADNWTSIVSMFTARGAVGVAGGLDGRIYAIGGFNGKTILNTAEVFTADGRTEEKRRKP